MLRPLLVSLLVTALVVLGGVVLLDPGQEEPQRQAPLPVALESLDTTALVVRRAAFCDAVPESDVAAAVGTGEVEATAYGNGEMAPVAGAEDVVHEFGCTWTAADGRAAAAWVFAPPVTPERATELVDAAAAGCEQLSAPAYGSPGVALLCPGDDPALATVSFRGLFGDAWLTCTLTAEAADAADPAAGRSALVDRTGRWCASVALAAADA